MTREVFAKLAPLNDLALERIRRPVVEDLMAKLAGRTLRRAEMALALLKRILRSAEARGQVVDPSVFHVRVARPEEREPRFLTLGGGRRGAVLDAGARLPRASPLPS